VPASNDQPLKLFIALPSRMGQLLKAARQLNIAANRFPRVRNGKEVQPSTIIVGGRGTEVHTIGCHPCRIGCMSLAPDELAAARRAIAGYDLTASTETRLIRLSEPRIARLLQLHGTACHLASDTPDILSELMARFSVARLCITNWQTLSPSAFGKISRHRMIACHLLVSIGICITHSLILLDYSFRREEMRPALSVSPDSLARRRMSSF
jgi:hypothetical protein